MAVTALDPQTTRNKSAIVAAYLKAFQLDAELDENGYGNIYEPETQFAYAALQGACERAMECGIYSLDHVALAALLCLDSISSVIDGRAVYCEGQRMIPVENARIGFLLTEKALKGIWEYASREAEMPREIWDPIASYCGVDLI